MTGGCEHLLEGNQEDASGHVPVRHSAIEPLSNVLSYLFVGLNLQRGWLHRDAFRISGSKDLRDTALPVSNHCFDERMLFLNHPLKSTAPFGVTQGGSHILRGPLGKFEEAPHLAHTIPYTSD